MLPDPSQMFTAAFPCCISSLLRAKVFPLPHLRIPHSACALQIAVLNTQWYLWSWPQVINSRCKTQVVHRKGFYKTKGCPLPERWDPRPQLTPLHRRFLSGALIAHADVCKPEPSRRKDPQHRLIIPDFRLLLKRVVSAGRLLKITHVPSHGNGDFPSIQTQPV